MDLSPLILISSHTVVSLNCVCYFFSLLFPFWREGYIIPMQCKNEHSNIVYVCLKCLDLPCELNQYLIDSQMITYQAIGSFLMIHAALFGHFNFNTISFTLCCSLQTKYCIFYTTKLATQILFGIVNNTNCIIIMINICPSISSHILLYHVYKTALSCI